MADQPNTFADSTWATNLEEYAAELTMDFMSAHETVYTRTNLVPCGCGGRCMMCDDNGMVGDMTCSTRFTAEELAALLRRVYEAGVNDGASRVGALILGQQR